MDRLRQMEVFVRIVDDGSLTAAASALGLSPPSVVRTLAALERRVGARLLNRTTRRSSLTDEGREYYERCRRVLAEAQAADEALSARRAAPEGRLRVTAPVTFGRMHVAPVVAELAARHPALEIELLLLDRVVDLVEDGIDAGVRIANLPESSLVARRVGESRRVVCAAPAYLRRAGRPARPADLARHRTIDAAGLGRSGEWRFGGQPAARVAVKPALRTNNVDAALEACLRGLGCGRFLGYQVAPHLRAGRLTRLLEAFEPPPVAIQIVYPHARLLSPGVRAFVELAVARLRAVSTG